MLGAMIVFVSVLLLVAVYMSIVHRFLKEGEEPGLPAETANTPGDSRHAQQPDDELLFAAAAAARRPPEWH